MPTKPSLPEILQRALEASARNDAEGALRLLREASADAPATALPQFLLGAELAQQGRVEEAEAAYANAVLLAPDFTVARFELGTLQLTSGRAALALVTWQPLLALPDGHALKLFVRAYAELAQGEFDIALECFHRGMAANTTNPTLNANIRLMVAAAEQARAQYASEAEPADDEGQHFLVSHYGRQGSLH